MSNYDFTTDEFHRIGDYLIAELAARENSPISESFAKTVIAKQNILREEEVIEENVKSTRFEWHNYGVTVNRDQFERVYTHYDEYPTPHDILRALHFPEYVLKRTPNSVRSIIGNGENPRPSSLLYWYNIHASPSHELEPLKNRKEFYSHAARMKAEKEGMSGGDESTTRVQPTIKQIDGGRRTVNNRTSRVVDAINEKDIFNGEFYNNMTKIPRKNWAHWLKFWDRRMGSVQPNKKKRLGKFIGKSWGKTFLLGYQVDRNMVYEIWYNSLDSTFSVYDMHGVEMGNPTPTLQEAIRDLLHVIAHMSSNDKENFGVGRTGASLVASLQRTLGNVMDQDVGVMKREEDLKTRELARQADDSKEEEAARKKEQQREANKQNRDTVGTAKKYASSAAAATKDAWSSAASKDYAGTAKNFASSAQAYASNTMDGASKLRERIRKNVDKIEADLRLSGSIHGADEFKNAARQNAEDKANKNIKKYDAARFVKKGQEQFDKEMKKREAELEIERKKEEAKRLQRQIQAALYNSEVSDPSLLEPIDPKYGIPPNALGINPEDGTQNPVYLDLALDLEKELERYNKEINQAQEFVEDDRTTQKAKDRSKKKRGLGDKMDWRSKSQRKKTNESLLDGLEGDAGMFGGNTDFGVQNPIYDPNIPSNPQHTADAKKKTPEIDDRAKNREVKAVRKQAEESPYNQALFMNDVSGSLKSYSETKIRRSSIVGAIGRWVQDTIARNRYKRTEGIGVGFWNRTMMFFRGQTFRADFIIGWSFADRLNFEIWYVTEPDPQQKSRLVSSFYVYDVNSQQVIRKFIPYYRIAISTIAAKVGVTPDIRQS